MTRQEWPPHLSKQDQNYFKNLFEKDFQDKNKVVWISLTDINYSRTALYLPSRYRKEATCDAHVSVTQKTYLKISTTYGSQI